MKEYAPPLWREDQGNILLTQICTKVRGGKVTYNTLYWFKIPQPAG